MIIGLVDVDGRTKKTRYAAANYPNLALAKISRYHKQRGDIVELAIPFVHYDIVYKSKVFNFSADDMICYNTDKLVLGGTGYDITSKLPHEIDCLQPDYSIYPHIPKTQAYGFLTRGCPNKCPWCVVPKKEGAIVPYMDVDEIAIEGRTKLILMDNNILAAGDYAHAQFDKIIKRGYYVDFNQAMDARLVDNDFAKQIARMKWIDKRIRFGCDTPAQIQQCENAIELIMRHGFQGRFFFYTILNDNFSECYNRINYWRKRNEQTQRKGVDFTPYAQPYRDPINPSRQPPQWQKDMAQWVNKHQLFHITSFADFSPRKGFKCATYLDTML